MKKPSEIWKEIDARKEAIFQESCKIEQAEKRIKELQTEMRQLSFQLSQSLTK